ncbi:MAG: hypothetical protein ACOYK8_04560 [Alphaproteobacteria bacterium]
MRLPSIIHLSYNLKISPEQHALYEKAGLCFFSSSHTEQDSVTEFDRVRVTENNPEQLTKNFSLLPYEDIHNLTGKRFKHTYLRNALNKAEQLNCLYAQSVVQDDGFPLATEWRPITWPLRGMIAEEIIYQSNQLKNFHIDHALVALEMEFSILPEVISGFSLWEEKKEAFISALKEECKQAEPLEKTILESKIAALKSFNAREVLMYDLIDHDPRTAYLLQPLFGISGDGSGYYDNRGCLELKTVPTDPMQLLENQRIILSVLLEKAADYGLIFKSYPSYHINMSFWDEEGDVLATDHPSYQYKGKKVIEGIASGVYDSYSILLTDYSINKKLAHDMLEFSVNREGFLRLSDGRFELRLAVDAVEQDVATFIPLLMGFAAFGLQQRPGELLQATPKKVPMINSFADEYTVLSHLIGNSTLREEGFLEMPLGYFKEKAADIGRELSIDHTIEFGGVMFKLSPRYEQQLLEFLQQIRIENQQIYFPKNDGGHSYLIHVPSVNMEKLPDHLKERINAGESGHNISELRKYIGAGELIPQPAVTLVINVEDLEQKLTLQSLKQLYVVSPGYPVNNVGFHSAATKEPLKHNRLARMEDSAAIKQMLSPEFCRGLMECVANAYGKSSDIEYIATRNIVPSRKQPSV